MSSEIDIKQVLSVYQKVIEKGEKQGPRFFYKGLFASPSFDGYNIELTDDKVFLTVFFHNKFNLEAKNSFELEAFKEKLERIDRVKVK